MTHFLHGNPIPPERFVGRRRERERVLNFIAHNGESAAVVGEPRVGKSSLLAYLASPQGRAEAQARSDKRLLFAEADAHLIGDGFDPARFWRYVFRPLETAGAFDQAEAPIGEAYRSCQASGYETTAFEHLLKCLGRAGYRLVLFVDEADYLAEQCLRHHPAFLAALRSLLKTGDLTLVAASRTPLSRLNVMAAAASGSGSPCFNTLREVILGAMMIEDVSQLLRAAGSSLSPGEDAFVREASGGYPYLVQVAAGALIEARDEGAGEEEARREAEDALLRATHDTLGDIWRSWSPELRYVFAAVAAAHIEALGEAAGRSAPDVSARASLAADTATYRQELDALRKRGFVSERGDRVRAFAFLAWFALRLRQRGQSAELWDQWLREEGWDRFWSAARRDAWNRGAFLRAMEVRTDIEALLLAHAARLSPSRSAPPPAPSSSRGGARPAPPPEPAAPPPREPIDVFLSYSHVDEALCNELATHLAVLIWNRDIRVWHDRQIGAGEDWRGAIDERLEAAQVVLLLVSSDFLASRYCWDVEMKRALERHHARQAQVIPVILRPCDWSPAPFARIQSHVALNGPQFGAASLSSGNCCSRSRSTRSLVPIAFTRRNAASPSSFFPAAR